MADSVPTDGDVGDGSVFAEILETFKRDLSPDIAHDFEKITSLSTLNNAIANLEGQQASRRSLRNLARIKPFLNILNDYAKVIEVFVNAKPDIMAFVWGPIKFCLLISSKYGKAFDALLVAYTKVKDALPNFKAIEDLYGSRTEIRRVLEDVYKDILSFHKRALTFFTQRGWKIALQVTTRTIDDMFTDILHNLDRSKQLLYTSTSIAHYQTVHEARLQSETHFSKQRENDLKERRMTVFNWLNATSHASQQNELRALRKRYPETSTWLTEDRAWKDFLDSRDVGQTFWLSGIPGAGKTVLFSAMVDQVHERCSNIADSIVVYLYCKYNDGLRNTFASLARSAVAALIGRNEHALNFVYDTAIDSSETFVAAKETLQQLLLKLTACYDIVYIGVDGLDECELPERRLITSMLFDVSRGAKDETNVQLFFTSQTEYDLEHTFASAHRLKLTPTHVRMDIQHYCRVRSTELNRFGLAIADIRTIAQQVADKANGMFLLAKLTFDMLEACVNREDFDECMQEELPRDIECAYERIICRIKQKDQNLRRPRITRLLEILAFAHRDLFVHEVQAILSIDTENRNIDIRRRRYTQSFKELCGPLIELGSDDTVHLVHSTAKSFLAKGRHELFGSVPAVTHYAESCVVYLTLDFCQPDMSLHMLKEAALRGDFAFHTYSLTYWIEHLRTTYHVLSVSFKQISDSNDSTLSKNMPTNSAGTLAESVEKLHSWYQTIEDDQERGLISPDVAFDHLRRSRIIIEELLASDLEKEAKNFLRDAYGGRPYLCPSPACTRFHVGFRTSEERDRHSTSHERNFKCTFPACVFSKAGFSTHEALKRHLNIFHIETLTTKFAKLKARSPSDHIQEVIETDDDVYLAELCETNSDLLMNLKLARLLCNAIQQHSLKSATLLITRYGDWSMLCKGGAGSSSPLSIAARLGHTEIVRQMVAKVGAPALSEKFLCSKSGPILCAASEGHVKPLLYLLSYVDEPSKSRIRATALQHALQHGQYDVVSKLWMDGPVQWYRRQEVDFNRLLAENLRKVADSGKFEDFQKILDCGILNSRVHAQILASLAGEGCKSGVAYLIERGQVQRLPAGTYEEALSSAVRNGHADVTTFLLRYHPVPTSEDHHDNPYLTRTRAKDKEESIVRLPGDELVTHSHRRLLNELLVSAARSGSKQVVSYILDQGADPNDGDKGWDSSLRVAVESGHQEIVLHLLERGADPNLVFDGTWSALSLASSLGRTSIVTALLQHGANLNLDGGAFGNALGAAAAESKLETMELLMSYGAILDAPCVCGSAYGEYTTTPLHVACESLQLKSVQWMLARDVDLTVRDSRGCTPLLSISRCIDSPHYSSSIEALPEILTCLINAGSHINDTDYEGLDALMKLCRAYTEAKRSILLHIQFFKSASHLLACAKLLLAEDPSCVHRSSHDGQTALHMLGESMDDVARGIMRLLVRNGANIDVKDSHGQSVRGLLENSNRKFLQELDDILANQELDAILASSLSPSLLQLTDEANEYEDELSPQEPEHPEQGVPLSDPIPDGDSGIWKTPGSLTYAENSDRHEAKRLKNLQQEGEDLLESLFRADDLLSSGEKWEMKLNALSEEHERHWPAYLTDFESEVHENPWIE